jgi:flagellar motor switch protein FliN/FliY
MSESSVLGAVDVVDTVGPVESVVESVVESAPDKRGPDRPVPDKPATDAGVVAALLNADVSGEQARSVVAGNRLDLLRNVEMEVTAELGSTRMTVRELLSLTPGNIVELNRAAGSPIDLLVNGTLIARGEVVVVDEEFGIRISEIVSPGPGDDR